MRRRLRHDCTNGGESNMTRRISEISYCTLHDNYYQGKFLLRYRKRRKNCVYPQKRCAGCIFQLRKHKVNILKSCSHRFVEEILVLCNYVVDAKFKKTMLSGNFWPRLVSMTGLHGGRKDGRKNHTHIRIPAVRTSHPT